MELAWKKIRNNIIQSATEAVGFRTVDSNSKKNTKPWFTNEVKVLARKRKKRSSNISITEPQTNIKTTRS